MVSNTSKGREGEDLAEKFLINNGIKIVGRNYRSKFGEIDLIGFEKSTIIFIEVKLRNNNQFGTPAEAITPTKLRRLHDTALLYMAQIDGDWDYRFDVVAIKKDLVKRCYYIEWFKDQKFD